MRQIQDLQASVERIVTQADAVRACTRELNLEKAMPDAGRIRAAALTLRDVLQEIVAIEAATESGAPDRERRHRVRNSVHAVLGYTEALLDDLDVFDAAVLREPLEILRSEIDVFWESVPAAVTAR